MRPITTLFTLLIAAGSAGSAWASTVVLNVDYEAGTLDAGGINDTNAAAADAATIVTTARTGQYAVSHKAVLNDPNYVSDGTTRSESDALSQTVAASRYTSGVQANYSFSLSMRNWEDWNGSSLSTDIVWQFKHTNGGPDAFVGVKRNSLILRYGASGQITIINDIRPLDNQWIDVKFDILWSDTNTGFIKGWVSTDGVNYTQFANLNNITNFDGGTGEFGYVKWGLYRPDSTTANGDAVTREIYHDNINVTVVPEPSTHALLLGAGAAALLRRKRRA